MLSFDISWEPTCTIHFVLTNIGFATSNAQKVHPNSLFRSHKKIPWFLDTMEYIEITMWCTVSLVIFNTTRNHFYLILIITLIPLLTSGILLLIQILQGRALQKITVPFRRCFAYPLVTGVDAVIWSNLHILNISNFSILPSRWQDGKSLMSCEIAVHQYKHKLCLSWGLNWFNY